MSYCTLIIRSVTDIDNKSNIKPGEAIARVQGQ